jgi:hypothetical protein
MAWFNGLLLRQSSTVSPSRNRLPAWRWAGTAEADGVCVGRGGLVTDSRPDDVRPRGCGEAGR